MRNCNFRKGFGEGGLKEFKDCFVDYNIEANLGSLSHYSIVCSSIKILSPFITNH